MYYGLNNVKTDIQMFYFPSFYSPSLWNGIYYFQIWGKNLLKIYPVVGKGLWLFLMYVSFDSLHWNSQQWTDTYYLLNVPVALTGIDTVYKVFLPCFMKGTCKICLAVLEWICFWVSGNLRVLKEESLYSDYYKNLVCLYLIVLMEVLKLTYLFTVR